MKTSIIVLFSFLLLNSFNYSSIIKKNKYDITPSFAQNLTLGTGVIAVTPSSVYDNDVAGGMQGLDRTITINNSGPGILSVSAINISGADAGEFILSGLPVFPQNISPAGSISFSVAFNPATIGIKTASVNINSDDASSPVSSVSIRGLGTSGLGGANEPSLQLLLNLFEIQVNVGDDDISTNVINSSVAVQKASLLGDEIKAPKFEKAGAGNVTITPLTVFGPTANSPVLGLGWYKSGDTTTNSELFTVSNNPVSNGQTVNVNVTGSLSFDPGSNVFGFYSRWPFFSNRHLYSEDNLNTFTGSAPHHVRVYPYKKNGAIVANSFIVAFEETISNLDYQDLVFLVQNVKPGLSNTLLFVENLDRFPSNDNFVFSKVQIPWSRDGIVFNDNHDSLKVRIDNKGLNPLIISSLTLSDSTTWRIEKFNGATYVPGSGLPFSVNSGNFVDLILKFTAADQASRVKVLHETLYVASNDDTYPTKSIFLHGLWQKMGEGNSEPYASEIINAFNFKTSTGFGHTDPDLGDSSQLKGSEIKPSYFVQADPSIPVSVRQMSAYHGCCNMTEKFVWYIKGSATLTTLFTHSAVDGQSVLPHKNSSTSSASGAFNSSSAFGFKIGSSDYTDATKNPSNLIGIRVWKAFDANGKIIPNSYIISNDYLGTMVTNYDYNDNTYFISNVKPELGTAYFSDLGVAPSDLDFGEKILQTNNMLQLSMNSLGKTYSTGPNDPLLTISSVVVTGENQSEFSATMPVKTTLNPQEATTLTVTFHPTSQGLKIADLLIYYNNSLSPKRVPLYGIGKEATTSVTVNYRINSGAATPIVINGKTWSADDQYSFDNLEPFTNPSLSQISATDEDALYLDEQSSNGDKKPFRYELPVPNGEYFVRLHFAEIYWGAPGSGSAGGDGSRVMSVNLEGQLRLINFDVTQEVGGASAVIKNFPVTVTDGKLNINFLATVNRPMLSALEVYSFSNGVLAVNFLEFKGNLKNNDVELQWVTGNNVNTKYFEVQKSIDNINFKSIGQVLSENSVGLSNYNFVDKEPGSTNNYYRIKEVDADGKFTYSKIIRIDFSKSFTLKLYPNPAKDKIKIQFSGLPGNQKAMLSIHSLSGSKLKSMPVILSGDKIEVDISSLSAGMYFLNLSSDNFVIHRKFIKNN